MPYDLAVCIEKRPVFDRFAGLLSYRVRLTYTDQDNWKWTGFDLLEEVSDAGHLVNYFPTSIDEAYPDRPVIPAALTALIRLDIGQPVVMDKIKQAIIDDIREREEEAAEDRYRYARLPSLLAAE